MPTDPMGDPLAFDPNLLGGAAPFDLSSMVAPQQPPPAAPPQPPQSAGKGKKKGALAEMALAAIAPIIASRHGQAGVAALVNGFQRAQAEQQQTDQRQAQTDFENQRQVQADQRAIEAQQANEQYRQQVLQGQQRNAAATLMKNGAAQLAAAETSEDADRIAQGLKMAGSVYGVRPEAMDALIAQNRPAPTALEQKQAQKYISQLEKTYGQDWAQKVGSATFVLPGAAPDPTTGKPQPITVQQLLAKSGLTMSGVPQKPPTERSAIPGSFEDFYTTTDPAARQKILNDRKAYGQADDSQRGGGIFAANGADDDVKRTVDAIINGNQPPTLQGFYGNTLKVRAELERRGYNFTDANLDYQATQQHFKTLNGAQQTRLRQAVDNAYHSLDVIEQLADQWKGGRFPALNKGRLAAARQGALGPDAQKIAVALEAQISDVTSELANVYMGGNSPTDHAMGLAAKNLQANWSEATLRALIAQQRTNLQIRSNSIKNAGAITPSSQAAPVESVPSLTKDAEVGKVYTYNGKKVRVREKTRTGFLFDEVPQ